MTTTFLSTATTSAKYISTLTGLTAIFGLNPAPSAHAASLSCSPGENWVETCESGSYDFLSSVTINVNFGINANNQPDFTALLSGTTHLFTGNPVDAVIDDPLLGDIGTLDGNLDVIPIEVVNSTSSGSTPFVPLITATAGDNVPDLAPTPFETELPFESLYSAGAIVETPGNPAQADSFFNLFLEIQGTPEGTIRARDPLMLTGLSPLTGFPLGTEQNSINYVSGNITPLFDSGSDGLFWTGDEIEVARLVPDSRGQAVVLTLSPASVSEPSMALSFLVIGLTMLLKCQNKSSSSNKNCAIR